jgi:pimeloyl-ACP methyl ester carboxylesterase
LSVAAPAAAQTFDATVPPAAPDYATPQAWAARGDAEGAAATVPAGATPAAKHAKVAVFYVHPTTFRHATQWNQDVADAATNRWTDASVIARQASIFNGCCAVYAPRYRQAVARAVGMLDGEGGKAFALAYTDVERAFDAFLSEIGDRPFVLAGHSQGGAHIATLLAKRIDGTPLATRMVAAYVIGYNLSEGDFGTTYKTLRPCDRPAQTGCVVGWNSVTAEADRAMLGGMMAQRYVKLHGNDAGKRIFCVNPLTFDRGKPEAPASASLGAVPGDPGAGPVAALRKGAVAAACRDGFLVVDVDPALALKPLPGGSMHFNDMGLFYADIRANVAARIAAYRTTHPR